VQELEAKRQRAAMLVQGEIDLEVQQMEIKRQRNAMLGQGQLQVEHMALSSLQEAMARGGSSQAALFAQQKLDKNQIELEKAQKKLDKIVANRSLCKPCLCMGTVL
jgi:hypothetical protein